MVRTFGLQSAEASRDMFGSETCDLHRLCNTRRVYTQRPCKQIVHTEASVEICVYSQQRDRTHHAWIIEMLRISEGSTRLPEELILVARNN